MSASGERTHAMLAALLDPDEVEVAYGRVDVREMTASSALLTGRRLLWRHLIFPKESASSSWRRSRRSRKACGRIGGACAFGTG
jgi:hypothetical protein